MTLHGVFYEEDDARAVAAALARDGFGAAVARDRLAGEDDDEDHPWAVVTDAPEFVVDLLVEERDGWLDRSDHEGRDGADPQRRATPAVPRPPLDLPDGPRRVKGHFRRD